MRNQRWGTDASSVRTPWHEDAGEGTKGCESEIGVIEGDSGLDSRAISAHEDVSDVVGGREGVVGVIESVNLGSD